MPPLDQYHTFILIRRKWFVYVLFPIVTVTNGSHSLFCLFCFPLLPSPMHGSHSHSLYCYICGSTVDFFFGRDTSAHLVVIEDWPMKRFKRWQKCDTCRLVILTLQMGLFIAISLRWIGIPKSLVPIMRPSPLNFPLESLAAVTLAFWNIWTQGMDRLFWKSRIFLNDAISISQVSLLTLLVWKTKPLILWYQYFKEMVLKNNCHVHLLALSKHKFWYLLPFLLDWQDYPQISTISTLLQLDNRETFPCLHGSSQLTQNMQYLWWTFFTISWISGYLAIVHADNPVSIPT